MKNAARSLLVRGVQSLGVPMVLLMTISTVLGEFDGVKNVSETGAAPVSMTYHDHCRRSTRPVDTKRSLQSAKSWQSGWHSYVMWIGIV